MFLKGQKLNIPNYSFFKKTFFYFEERLPSTSDWLVCM